MVKSDIYNYKSMHSVCREVEEHYIKYDVIDVKYSVNINFKTDEKYYSVLIIYKNKESK